MNLVSDLLEFIIAQAEVSAIVGDKVFTGWADQDESLPYLVIRPQTEDYPLHSTGQIGHVNATIQINCHGRTFEKAQDLKETVRETISDKLGAVGTNLSYLSHCTLSSVNWLFPTPLFGDQFDECVATMTYTVTASASVPTPNS